jgi:2-polyprenyl-3-methyl-5-hydroxy-6-metoxy-1,4-benzoquinol methylase
MGGLSSLTRLGAKGLKKYLLDYKFKSPPRYEGGRNIGPLETMASTKEIEAPSLQDAKKLLKKDSSYIRDRQKLKDEIGEEANPRVSFDRITEDGNIIKEAASKKRFRLEQEARVLPYLEPQNLPVTNMGDKKSFLPTINKIINDPKLNETQKNKIIGYVNQYTDGLITPEELYNKSLMATKEVAPEAAQKTQRSNTTPTYKKAEELLNKKGKTLDYGAGKGLGAKEIKADTFEPYAENWKPDYNKSSDIPTESYENITSLNVLNVLQKGDRDQAVKEIGRVLKPDGTAIISTRGSDVLEAKGTLGDEAMSIITSTGTYQKGFTPDELVSYTQDLLGPGYIVEKVSGIGKAAIKITKLNKKYGGRIMNDPNKNYNAQRFI